MRNQKHQMNSLNVNMGDSALPGESPSKARRARDTIMSIYGQEKKNETRAINIFIIIRPTEFQLS
jgi:hypothetical protein